MFDPERFEHELAQALDLDREVDDGEVDDGELPRMDTASVDGFDDHELDDHELDDHEFDDHEFDDRGSDDHESDDRELGDDPTLEHELEQALACAYQPGEIVSSRKAAGILPVDVYPHPKGGFMIVDFGVAQRAPKPGATESAALRRWIARSNWHPRSEGVEIVGYTDCVGAEDTNRRLRVARAVATRMALGPQFSGATVKASPHGELLYADNTTPGGRAMNRGVWIRVPDRDVRLPAEPMSADPVNRPRVPRTWPSVPWNPALDGSPEAWVVEGAHPPRSRPRALDFWKGWASRVRTLVTSKSQLKRLKAVVEAALELSYRPWLENRKWPGAVTARSDYSKAYALVWRRARVLASEQSTVDRFPQTYAALVSEFVPQPSSASLTDVAVTAARIDAVERMNTLLEAGGVARLRGLLLALRESNLVAKISDPVYGLPQR